MVLFGGAAAAAVFVVVGRPPPSSATGGLVVVTKLLRPSGPCEVPTLVCSSVAKLVRGKRSSGWACWTVRALGLAAGSTMLAECRLGRPKKLCFLGL